jgi:hypothetical protein
MASKIETTAKKERPFRWKVFGAGIASVVVGYVLLSLNDVTVAPILLVLGYCVLVPLAFL